MYEYNELFALSCSAAAAASTSTGNYYAYENTQFSNSSPTLYFPPPPPAVAAPSNEFDSAILKSEFGYSSGSSYGGSPSSLPSYCYNMPGLVQRSMSSHSLLQKDNAFYHPIFSSLDESRPEVFDFDNNAGGGGGSMRKVFSTGDLQATNTVQHSGQADSPLSHESCTIDGMNKVGRYSAEERKERIERYRSKRNQRNFNKKIKYACRKTLADSRPRIRGRFARNDEIGENSQAVWHQMGREETEDEELWLNLFDTFSVNLMS